MMHKHGEHCKHTMIGGTLVIVGAINWGLVGLGGLLGSNLNVINLIFGRIAYLEDIIYILVGLAGVMMIFGCKAEGCCSKEDKGKEAESQGE